MNIWVKTGLQKYISLEFVGLISVGLVKLVHTTIDTAESPAFKTHLKIFIGSNNQLLGASGLFIIFNSVNNVFTELIIFKIWC